MRLTFCWEWQPWTTVFHTETPWRGPGISSHFAGAWEKDVLGNSCLSNPSFIHKYLAVDRYSCTSQVSCQMGERTYFEFTDRKKWDTYSSKDNQGILLLGRMVKWYSPALYLGRNRTVTIQLENVQEVFQKGYNPFQCLTFSNCVKSSVTANHPQTSLVYCERKTPKSRNSL